jgi:hypothetical protein
MVTNNGFTGTYYTYGKVDHRSSDHMDRGRHQSRHPMRRYGAHGDEHHTESNHANYSSDDDQFDRAASVIVAVHHYGNKLHSQTVVVDSGATRHMFYDLSVFRKLESIAPTTVKLGDDSTANCAQIGEVVLYLSDGHRLHQSQVLYVPRLAINLLSVSQLSKKGIMTFFTRT